MSNDSKFDNVPEDELKAYIEDSVQRPGESDTDWAERNRRAEADLVAKYRDRPAPASEEGSEPAPPFPQTAPDEREDQPQ